MKPSFLLKFDEFGKAELLRNGHTLWASDSDEDVAEEFGTDFFEDKGTLADELVDYLAECGVLTWNEAERVEIESFGPGDDEEEDEDDEIDEEGVDDFVMERR